MLSPADFIDDSPWVEEGPFLQEICIGNQIEGVRLNRLVTHKDDRGDLTVLLSDLKGAKHPHVCRVTAAQKLRETWVYHKRRSDRLAYTNGNLQSGTFLRY